MRWAEIIEERVRGAAVLYHATPHPVDAARIVYENKLAPFTTHRAEQLGLPSVNGESYVKGVSLSRSYEFVSKWRSDGNSHGSVIFVLDRVKLQTRFMLRPFDYFQSRTPNRDPKARSEAEEFCITQNGIEPLDRYLIEIQMSRSLYDECLNEDMEDWGGPENPDAMYGPLLLHPKLKII